MDEFREVTKMIMSEIDKGINVPNKNDSISRRAAIDALTALEEPAPTAQHVSAIYDCEDAIKALPSEQPEPLSDAYMNAVWTWLLDYQIKAAKLKGRYTPYEVLSWVINDWRKENG